MKRDKVSSSNLASIGYDEKNNILEVEFNHGGIYQYSNVSYYVYEELMKASSHGTYFSANIRNNKKFTTEKIK
jgi:hypothetical protein